jgi:hypothetical protein
VEGRGKGWAVVAAVAALAMGVFAAGCSESGADDVAPVATEEPVGTFAPLISMHPDERWRPTNPIDFVARSTLRWIDSKCGDVRIAAGPNAGTGLPEGRSAPPPAGVPPLDQAKLAINKPFYRHEAGEAPGCKGGKTFTTADYTRPFDPERPAGIRPDQGFVLDPADLKRHGLAVVRDYRKSPHISLVASYVQRDERHDGQPAIRITYWLLFATHAPQGRSPAIAALAHEGDWERVSVLLRIADGKNRYTPVSVRYHKAGGSYDDVPWQSVTRYRIQPAEGRTHPAVFAARGSHTPYPKPGSYPASERGVAFRDEARACPDCIEWRTWEMLLDAAGQSWYGYGGGWGDSRTTRAPTALGPSKWIPSDPPTE